MLTKEQAPWTTEYGIAGSGQKSAGPTARALKRFAIRMGTFDGLLATIDDNYNLKLEVALDRLDPGKNGYGKGRWALVRTLRVPANLPNSGEYALDGPARTLLVRETKTLIAPRSAPNLGPIVDGGQLLLDQDLTHPTSGIPLYPAFDDAFAVGYDVLAPERMVVSRDSSSNPGRAFYATGDSKLKYWFAHLDRTHYAGQVFNKGAFVGNVAPNYIGGGPHCHVGVNVELLLGWGEQLAHRTNYTHGAPTIRAQLLGKW